MDCQRNLLQALRHESRAETTGKDNLKKLQLVNAAYQSMAAGTTIQLTA